MSDDEIVERFHQILSTLQRIVAASGGMAERVDELEERSGQTLGTVTEIQSNVRILLDAYQQYTQTQRKLYEDMIQAFARLEARVTTLEARKPN